MYHKLLMSILLSLQNNYRVRYCELTPLLIPPLSRERGDSLPAETSVQAGGVSPENRV